MRRTPDSFVLITNVMAEAHCVVLQDWFDFLDVLPERLLVFVGKEPAIADRLARICEARDIALEILDTTDTRRVRQDEPAIVMEQFQAAGSGLVMIVRLDTLPFRRTGDPWQTDAIAAMRHHGAIYLTGSTLPYRSDTPTDDPRYMHTRKVSNNFLLMDRDEWLRIQEAQREPALALGRFAQENAVEFHCRDTGDRGIKLVNTPDFRIVHTQEWGPRMRLVRACYRRGIAITPQLTGFQEDWDARRYPFYLQHEAMPIKRARIAFGRWRRDVAARFTGR